jgi:hypothetical protein
MYPDRLVAPTAIAGVQRGVHAEGNAEKNTGKVGKKVGQIERVFGK